jgi:hypothetical protein
VNAMEGKPPPLGALLRQVQNDIRATARVDAAGSTDRLQSGHAAALTLLLRDAVLKRDWSRAAGAHTQYDPPRARRSHLPVSGTALATAGLVAGAAALSDPRPFFRRADASIELLQLVWRHGKSVVHAPALTRVSIPRPPRSVPNTAPSSRRNSRRRRDDRHASARDYDTMPPPLRTKDCNGLRRWL